MSALIPPQTDSRRRYESEFVAAVLRLIFVLVALLLPAYEQAFEPSRSYLAISFLLVIGYDVILMLSYWWRIELPWHRPGLLVMDLMIISLWVYLCGAAGRQLHPLYYVVLIMSGLWLRPGASFLVGIGAVGLYLLSLGFGAASAQRELALAGALRYDAPFILLLGLIVSYVAEEYRRRAEQARQQEQVLQAHWQRIRVAESISRLLLPETVPEVEGLELGVRFRPAGHAVTGDYYEFIPLSRRQLGICVADVAGKLEPGVVGLLPFKFAVKMAARARRRPAEVLKELNRLVLPELQVDQFISLSYSTIDLDQMTLTSASAGVERPLLLREGEALRPGAVGLPLGVVAGADYAEEQLGLEPGDLVIFFTDGATEVVNAAGEELGSSGLEALARGAALAPTAEETAHLLLRGITRFGRGGKRRDDISLVVVRVRESGPAPRDQT